MGRELLGSRGVYPVIARKLSFGCMYVLAFMLRANITLAIGHTINNVTVDYSYFWLLLQILLQVKSLGVGDY